MRILVVILLFLCAVSAVNGGFPDWSPTVGLKVTTPQKISVSIGFSSIPWNSLWGGGSGLVFRLEPGLAGGKVHLGVRSAFSMVFIPITSVDICCSLMYTWNNPWNGLANDQTYAGIEARGGFHLFILSAGIYRHVSGVDADHDWIFSGGVGLGF
ncbi:hypothetical protein DRQ25_13595 [Candidatus Fermentibacteria bacterium]|nr:MAG: hypothetical protein DRQ25_13595 [Candidatus Fermentibacteria bacterium]